MCETIKKYKILLVIELLLLFILLLGCVQKEYMVYSENDIKFGGETGNVTYQSLRFRVKPGVYQVRIESTDIEDNSFYIGAECEQSSFRAMRCNGTNIYAGMDYADFEIYVLETIDTAYINAYSSGNLVSIDSVEVYQINWGYRILTFVYVVFCLCLNSMLVFREGILSGQISKEKQVVFWSLVISVLVAYFPYMTDYFSDAADIAFHWLRIESLKETLMQGNQFPVRVQSNWLSDHGYAVSAFYGDLFLLIPVLFRFVGFTLMDSYKLFVLVVMAATAAITYYSLKQCTKHAYSALFGSIIYMLAPYRIYNFYNRGAVGEYLAMTFFPLVICGMYRLYTEETDSCGYQTAKIPLIAGLTCILQSHILSCEMAVIFILIVCVAYFKKTFRKQTFIQLLQSAGICLLLNAWFWFPLLKMMVSDKYVLSEMISKNIQYMGTWLAEVVQFYPNQGTAQNGMYMAEPFQMGAASFLMLAFMVLVLIRKLIRKTNQLYQNPYDRIVWFWCIAIVVSWFLSTRYFPWDLIADIPVVSVLATAIQFPTRLSAIFTVLSAFAAAFFVLWFGWECKERITNLSACKIVHGGICAVLLILAVGSAVYHVNDLAYSDSPIWLYNGENLGTISVVNGEYLLKNTSPGEYYYHDPVAEEGLEWTDYEKNGTSIDISVKNTELRELFLELPLIGYKGYEVEADALSGQVPYITAERGDHGDLRIAVPGGYEGRLKISYKGFVSFRVAEVISAATAAILAAYWMYRRLRWKSQKQQLSGR